MHRNPNSWRLIALFFAAFMLFCLGSIQGNPVDKPVMQKDYVFSNSPPAAAPAIMINESLPICVTWIAVSTPGDAISYSAEGYIISNSAGALNRVVNLHINNYSLKAICNTNYRQRLVKHHFIRPRERLRQS